MNELVSGFRYSDTYKRNIRGNDCCPFWRVDNSGVCVGWPHYDKHICPANESGSGCPLFPTNEEKELYKSLRGSKRLKRWLDNEIATTERELYGRTAVEQARADIYRQLTTYLICFGIDPSSYVRYMEEFNGVYYAVTYLSFNGKQCILASCDNIADPKAEVLIHLFR